MLRISPFVTLVFLALFFLGLQPGVSLAAEWEQDARALLDALRVPEQRDAALQNLQLLVFRVGSEAFSFVEPRISDESTRRFLGFALLLRREAEAVKASLPDLRVARRVLLPVLVAGPEEKPSVTFGRRAWLLEESRDHLLCLCDPVPPDPLCILNLRKADLAWMLESVGETGPMVRPLDFEVELEQRELEQASQIPRGHQDEPPLDAALYAGYALARERYPEALRFAATTDPATSLELAALGYPFALVELLMHRHPDRPFGRDLLGDIRRAPPHDLLLVDLPKLDALGPGERTRALAARLADAISTPGDERLDPYLSPARALGVATRLHQEGPRAIPYLIERLRDRSPTRTTLPSPSGGSADLLRVCDLALLIIQDIAGRTFLDEPISRSLDAEGAIQEIRIWWETSSPAGDPTLVRVATRGPRRAAAVSFALRRSGARALEGIRDQLKDRDTRQGVARFLAGDEGSGFESAGETRRHSETRLEVARALGADLPVSAVLEQVSRTIEERTRRAPFPPEVDPHVVVAWLDVLADNGQYGALVRAVREARDPAVRRLALDRLGRVQGGASTPYLSALLQDDGLLDGKERTGDAAAVLLRAILGGTTPGGGSAAGLADRVRGSNREGQDVPWWVALFAAIFLFVAGRARSVAA